MKGEGFRVKGEGFSVWGLQFTVYGLGLEFTVWAFKFWALNLRI